MVNGFAKILHTMVFCVFVKKNTSLIKKYHAHLNKFVKSYGIATEALTTLKKIINMY